MTRRLVRVLAALILGAAGGTVVMASTAYAAACPAGTGVTVVVNSSVRCDSNGGGSAASNFRDAGHTLTMASRQPGFVCRVDGYDPNDPCVNASPSDRYWALFWSNGKGGGWTYASSGASSLSVPTGGWVAFKFQTSSSRSAPGVNPYTPPPAPAPKPATKPKATSTTTAPSKPNASASASAKAAEKKAEAKASASASASPSASGDSTSSEDDLVSGANETDGSGPMVWVGAALAALLIIGMGAAAWRRRLAGRQP